MDFVYLSKQIKQTVMKKSDLKTGMLVENRGGKIGLVMLQTFNGDVVAGGGNIPGEDQTWFPLKSLNEDLTYRDVYGSDIVKVYEFSTNSEGASFKKDRRNLVWERKDTVIKLTSDYDAIVDTATKSVKVGCQSIPFHKVTELYHLINK